MATTARMNMDLWTGSVTDYVKLRYHYLKKQYPIDYFGPVTTGELNKDGTVDTSVTTKMVTDYIPCGVTRFYFYNTWTTSQTVGYCLYDVNKRLLRYDAGTTTLNWRNIAWPPTGKPAAYIRISINPANLSKASLYLYRD